MILWLTSKKGYSPTIRAVLSATLKNAGISVADIMFNSCHIKTPTLSEHDPKKMPDKWAIQQARKNLGDDIKILKPKVIVINDEDTLRAITQEKYTLATVRGSVYYFAGVPCIVMDAFATIRYKKYGKFIFELDLAKVSRWAKGIEKNEPAFHYIVCKTVDEVAHACAEAESATFIATDRETAGGFISCTSYTYDIPGGKLKTFVVPFYDPWTEDGAYWRTEKEEIAVHNLLRKLNANGVMKGLQNGTYDSAYDILYGMPLSNYFVDTQNLMHSIWVEAPKDLASIASYFVDHYTYWKDENKGVKEDGFGRSPSDIQRYWRYNGLDSYYTWLSASELLSRIRRLPWAMRNYNSEFRLSVGPCLAASLRGLLTDKNRHAWIMAEQSEKFEQGKSSLRNLSNEEDFNVNSPYDVAWLLYDVLGAKKTRLQRKGSKYGPRSTDEKVLRLMKEQGNFFLNNAIDRLLAAKKPGSVLSKYGDYNELTYKNGRFLSWHNAAGTETFRLNSGDCQFWTGTNAQNLQPFVQEMFVADKDFVLVDCDYSASDDWFIAHEAQDLDKINLLLSGKDVHSYHAAEFFKLKYDEIILGKKKHEAWVVDAILGVRQIAKKVAHGKNFRMGAVMLYNLMGRDMAVAVALRLGHEKAYGYTDKELIGICQELCEKYDNPRHGMYKRIRPWQDETVQELKNNGGLATNAFGITRHFFGSPDDHAVQRELSAFFGQSGTSGNINRALNKIFWSGIDDGRLCLFAIQVHDSLKFLIHRSVLKEKINQIKEIMEEEVTLKGRTFHVPVNVEVGLTDGKKMLPWRDDLTYEEILAHEKKTYGEKFPKGSQALLDKLNNMNFDAALMSDLEERLSHVEDGEDGLDQDGDDLEIALNESEN